MNVILIECLGYFIPYCRMLSRVGSCHLHGALYFVGDDEM